MNREEAAAAGKLRYDSDKPCKHGHRPQRYTKTGICVQCAAANTAKNRNNHTMRTIAGMMGLVDLAGVRVRPADVEAVMAVVDACNLMSGAPVANRPACSGGPIKKAPDPSFLAAPARRATVDEIDARRAEIVAGLARQEGQS